MIEAPRADFVRRTGARSKKKPRAPQRARNHRDNSARAKLSRACDDRLDILVRGTSSIFEHLRSPFSIPRAMHIACLRGGNRDGKGKGKGVWGRASAEILSTGRSALSPDGNSTHQQTGAVRRYILRMTAIRELANWIPLTASGVAFFSTMSVLAAWRMYFRRAGSRDPGRAAGQARRDALSQAGLDAAEYAALGLLILPLAAGINAAWWGAARASPAPDALWLLACSALGLQGWTLWRLLGALRRAQRLRDGYDAELVASQELNGLGGLGYYVFHDVPLGERIAKADHVLVGPAGIFAVQTEARAGRGADAEREVTYDGASLCFARHRETAPLERAIARAARLREWLTVETGQSIPVQPVLMLPGWRVRRTDISGIPVLATSRVRHYFSRLRPRMGMSELLIEQVARSLDTRCQGPAVEPAQ